MGTPAKKKQPNRDKTWRKYYNVIESFMCGSKRIDVLSCVWCEEKNEPFQLQSVRIRCVRHLVKSHGWDEETDIFEGTGTVEHVSGTVERVINRNASVPSSNESIPAELEAESGTETNGSTSTSTNNDQIQIEVINDHPSDSSQNNISATEEDWKKYWEPAQTSVAARKGPVFSCRLCTASGKTYELISSAKRCSRHLTTQHGWLASSDTFLYEESSKVASSLGQSALNFSQIATASIHSSSPRTALVPASASSSTSSMDIANGEPRAKRDRKSLTESESEKAEYLLVAWAYSSNINYAAFDNPFWKEFLALINDSFKPPASKELLEKLAAGFELNIRGKREDADE